MEPSNAQGRKTLERDKERPELKAGVGTACMLGVVESLAARNIECILKSRRYMEAINPEFAIDVVKKARQF